MAADVILRSLITCPHCGAAREETMPTDACVYSTSAPPAGRCFARSPAIAACSARSARSPVRPCRFPAGVVRVSRQRADDDVRIRLDRRDRPARRPRGALPGVAAAHRRRREDDRADNRRLVRAAVRVVVGNAMAPYLQSRWVPDIALDNISFAFGRSTAFERAALHAVGGVVVAGDPRAADASISTVPDAGALRRALRDVADRPGGRLSWPRRAVSAVPPARAAA